MILETVQKMQAEGKKVSMMHLRYIHPLPKNIGDILSRFRKIIVCELNLGQMAKYLKVNYPQYEYHQMNKVQGLPFMVSELTKKFNELLED